MKTLLTLATFLALTATTMADEPAGGTLIELSAVGIFVLLTSLLMLMGKRRPGGWADRLATRYFPRAR